MVDFITAAREPYRPQPTRRRKAFSRWFEADIANANEGLEPQATTNTVPRPLTSMEDTLFLAQLPRSSGGVPRRNPYQLIDRAEDTIDERQYVFSFAERYSSTN